MNIKDAKQIRIVEYLRIIGYSPVNVKGHQYWYLSPFRDEKTASFKVNDAINEWYDFGTTCNAGLTVSHSFPYDHDSSLDSNLTSVYSELNQMEQYQEEEVEYSGGMHR